jgi:multiple sugar transport system ATP-binding protein
MEVYRKPANLYVAGFIGSPAMNFLSGTLEVADGQAIFASSEYHTGFSANSISGLSRQAGGRRPVLLGIRPEGFEIHPAPQPEDLVAEVFLVEPIGSVTHLDLRAGQFVLKATVDPTLRINVGDQIGLRMPDSNVYFFDPQTGACV